MDTFEARLARLEQHLATHHPESAEECLAIAEDSFAAGDAEKARFWLEEARWERSRKARTDEPQA
jgi:hypothetical protein